MREKFNEEFPLYHGDYMSKLQSFFYIRRKYESPAFMRASELFSYCYQEVK